MHNISFVIIVEPVFFLVHFFLVLTFSINYSFSTPTPKTVPTNLFSNFFNFINLHICSLVIRLFFFFIIYILYYIYSIQSKANIVATNPIKSTGGQEYTTVIPSSKLGSITFAVGSVPVKINIESSLEVTATSDADFEATITTGEIEKNLKCV